MGYHGRTFYEIRRALQVVASMPWSSSSAAREAPIPYKPINDSLPLHWQLRSKLARNFFTEFHIAPLLLMDQKQFIIRVQFLHNVVDACAVAPNYQYSLTRS